MPPRDVKGQAMDRMPARLGIDAVDRASIKVFQYDPRTGNAEGAVIGTGKRADNEARSTVRARKTQ
jgi:hypothetical protein